MVDRPGRDVDCMGKTGSLSTRRRAHVTRRWISVRFSARLPQSGRGPKSTVGLLPVGDLRVVHPHIHSLYYDYVFLTSRKIGSTNR